MFFWETVEPLNKPMQSQLLLAPRRKRVQSGVSTSDVVLSTHVGNNEDLFPKILKLHVPPGSTIADVTYGKGVFWKRVPAGKYVLKPTDIKTGVDCRKLPYES